MFKHLEGWDAQVVWEEELLDLENNMQSEEKTMGDNELSQRIVLALGFLLLLLYKGLKFTVKFMEKFYTIIWIYGEVFLAFDTAIGFLSFDYRRLYLPQFPHLQKYQGNSNTHSLRLTGLLYKTWLLIHSITVQLNSS